MIQVSAARSSLAPITLRDSSAHVMLQVLGYLTGQAAASCTISDLEREVDAEDLQARALVMLWAEEAITAAAAPGFDPARTIVRLQELERLADSARRHGTPVSWRHVA